MTTQQWLALVGLAIAIPLLVSQIYSVRGLIRRQSSQQARFARLVEARLRNDAAQPSPSSILGTGLRTYYYLDESEVGVLYSQLSEAEERLRHREVEEGRENSFGVEATISAVRPSLSRKKGRTVKELYDIETSAATSMVRIETKLLEGDQISVIDVPDAIDASPVDAHLDALTRTTGFPVPQTARKELEAAWDEFRRAKGLERLSNYSGYVAIQGDFEVDSDESGDTLLVKEVSFGAHTGQIRIICRERDALRSAGRSALRPGVKVRVTCLGKVISWNAKSNALSMFAISVF